MEVNKLSGLSKEFIRAAPNGIWRCVGPEGREANLWIRKSNNQEFGRTFLVVLRKNSAQVYAASFLHLRSPFCIYVECGRYVLGFCEFVIAATGWVDAQTESDRKISLEPELG